MALGGVDPSLEPVAAEFLESGALQGAVFQGDDIPVESLEDGFDAVVQACAHYAIKALLIVVNDSPGIAQAMLPAFEQALIDTALAELGIADQGHHAALGARRISPGLGADVILNSVTQRR